MDERELGVALGLACALTPAAVFALEMYHRRRWKTLYGNIGQGGGLEEHHIEPSLRGAQSACDAHAPYSGRSTGDRDGGISPHIRVEPSWERSNGSESGGRRLASNYI